VPLSEEEQRILQEIEQQLYASDPQLVRDVTSTTVYRHAGRNLRWAALGFVTGLVLMLATFANSVVLGGLGFFAMLGSAILVERNLRRMGRAGLQALTDSVRASTVRDRFGSAGQRMRDRFRGDDHS
jgi:hypothetical protein